jgi:hypothetical protein
MTMSVIYGQVIDVLGFSSVEVTIDASNAGQGLT